MKINHFAPMFGPSKPIVFGVQKTLQVSTEIWERDKYVSNGDEQFLFCSIFSHLIIGSLCVVRPQGGEGREGQLVGRRCTDNIFFVLCLFLFQTDR